ncbi:hypothetical protein [Dubosiella newyorkensis]
MNAIIFADLIARVDLMKQLYRLSRSLKLMLVAIASFFRIR